jgi:hypothetical protein
MYKEKEKVDASVNILFLFLVKEVTHTRARCFKNTKKKDIYDIYFQTSPLNKSSSSSVVLFFLAILSGHCQIGASSSEGDIYIDGELLVLIVVVVVVGRIGG